MKQFLAILFILSIPAAIFSQEVPQALQQKLRGKNKLTEIMKEVDAFYLYSADNADKDEEEFENSPYLKWKRWEWYMRSRLDNNGNFTDYRKQKDVEFAKLNTANRPLGSTAAKWSFIGPHQMTTVVENQIRGLGRVDCIAFHPTNASIIFVGSPGGGVWKTTDGGGTWQNISFNLPNTAVSSIAVSKQNPDVIYIATGDFKGGSFTGAYTRSSIGVYKTTDGGIFWNPVGISGDTVLGNASKIIVHPANDKIVWVATTVGVYKTTDGGNNWFKYFNGECTDICLKPDNPNTVYISGRLNGLINYSFNGGLSFYPTIFNVPTSIVRARLGVSANNPAIVYALCGPMRQSGSPLMTNRYEGFFLSRDSGRNFTKINNSPNILGTAVNGIDGAKELDQSYYDLALAINPSDVGTIATGGKTVWRTINGGTSFTSATDYREISGQMYRYIHPDIQDLAYNPLNNYLYAASDGGVYRSIDNGVSWTDLSAGIHTTMFYKLAGTEQNANLLIGGTQDNGVKSRTTASSNFDHIMGGDGFDAVIDPTNSTLGYASGNTNIYKLVNGTAQGTLIPPAGAAGNYPKLAHHQTQSGILYAGYTNGLWVFVANAWSLLDSFTLKGAIAVITCPSDANRVYFTDGTAIYRSDNGGFIWTGNLALNIGFTGTPVITDIYVCPTNANFIYATNSNGTAGQKVYASNDAGVTWFNISGSLPNVAINCAAVDNGNNLYVGTDLGVFYKGVSSAYWVPYYNGLPKVIISDLVINHTAGKITAATYGHGVWQTDLYSTCDANYAITGSYTGEHFFSVSNQLTSTAEVYGGAGSKMHFRAANEIVLSPGFIVYNSSNFDAVLADCQTGAIPENKISNKLKVELSNKSKKKLVKRKILKIE
jgi:photosystem II stability/assembly factor-like uncharacterized protein